MIYWHHEYLEETAVWADGDMVCVQFPDDSSLFLRPDWAWQLGVALSDVGPTGAWVHWPGKRDLDGPTVVKVVSGRDRGRVVFKWAGAPGRWGVFTMTPKGAAKLGDMLVRVSGPLVVEEVMTS